MKTWDEFKESDREFQQLVVDYYTEKINKVQMRFRAVNMGYEEEDVEHCAALLNEKVEKMRKLAPFMTFGFILFILGVIALIASFVLKI